MNTEWSILIISVIVLVICVLILVLARTPRRTDLVEGPAQPAHVSGSGSGTSGISNSPFADTIIGGIVSTQMRYANGQTTLVRKLLGNSDETIILLHNSPFDQQVWYALFTYAQLQYENGEKIPTLISYDLTGHGTAWIPVDPRFNDKDPANVAWTLDTFADELFQIYDAYSLNDKVTLVGYGVGSRIAQVFALKHPELVSLLFILQSGLGLVGDTSGEISYFSDWINANPGVSYLTIEEDYVRTEMCKWFQTLDRVRCPDPANAADNIESFGTTEYLLADKLWRTASATTFLQVSKIGSTANLRQLWLDHKNNGGRRIDVVLLSAERDNYVTVEAAKADIQTLKEAGADVTGYITTGKHGFTIVQTDYIYDLLTGVSIETDARTVQVL